MNAMRPPAGSGLYFGLIDECSETVCGVGVVLRTAFRSAGSGLHCRVGVVLRIDFRSAGLGLHCGVGVALRGRGCTAGSGLYCGLIADPSDVYHWNNNQRVLVLANKWVFSLF